MPDEPSPAGATTSAAGTPFAVDLSRDRQARGMWLVFLGGPLLWFAHFMFVYLVAEAGCSGDGPGLDLFDPPVPRTATLVATALAAAACLLMAVWALRRWRTATQEPAPDADDRTSTGNQPAGGTLPGAGFLLASFSFVAIVFTGLPAAFLPPC